MLRAEILSVEVRDYEVPNKDGSKQKRYSQEEIYLYTGARFPLVISVNIDSVAECYPPGEYILNPKCLRVSKYGGLELDSYNISLLPATKPVLAAQQPNK